MLIYLNIAIENGKIFSFPLFQLVRPLLMMHSYHMVWDVVIGKSHLLTICEGSRHQLTQDSYDCIIGCVRVISHSAAPFGFTVRLQLCCFGSLLLCVCHFRP